METVRESMEKVRQAVKSLLDVSDVSGEVELELAKLSREDRAIFVVQAGAACGELGRYIAAAGDLR